MATNKRIAEAILDKTRVKKDLTVEELVDEVAKSLKVGKHEVAREIYRLWKEESKVKLEDLHPPSTFPHYVKSLYSLWFWVLAAIVSVTALTIYLFPQAPPYVYVRYALGSIFVLYLSGFSLIESLFPKREDLEPIERLALSIGLSLAVVPLVGLVLNYTPWGIRLDPVFLSLAILTIALSALAMRRKFGQFRKETKAEKGSYVSR